MATEEKIELAKKSLESTAQKINEVELEVPGSRIIPLAPAAVPQEKDRGRQTKIAGAGGLGVFIFALFGVAFIEFRSRKIGLAEEVDGLGLKLLGTMPALPTRKTDATRQREMASSAQRIGGRDPHGDSPSGAHRIIARPHDHQRSERRGQNDAGDATGRQPGPRLEAHPGHRRRSASSRRPRSL